MGKMARNEARKLTAALLNAIAATLLTGSIIATAWRGSVLAYPWTVVLSLAVVALICHLLGRAVLRWVED